MPCLPPIIRTDFLLIIISSVYFKFVGKPISNHPSTPCSNFSPAKLVPTPRKSYKMFFQNATHFLPKSVMLLVGMRRASSVLGMPTQLNMIEVIVVNVTKSGLSQLQH